MRNDKQKINYFSNPNPLPRYRITIGEIRSLAGFMVAPAEDLINRILKIKHDVEVSKQTHELINTTGKMAEGLVHPAAIYGIFPNDSIDMNWCEDAYRIALAIVTIGAELESKVEQLHETGKIAQATTLDAFGSGWVEGAVEGIDLTIGQEAVLLGLKRDRRRSPGYHPWDLSGQEDIFSVLPAKRINVELSKSFMMKPRKTVSFGVPLYS